MLARPELEQLAQRVIARFHLDALTEAESAQYIAHRLDVAGHTGPLPFERAALKRIHRLARGVPRRINLLCGRALLGAWANGLHRVDRKVVDKAAAEVFGLDAAAGAAPARGPPPTRWAALALLAGAGAGGSWGLVAADPAPRHGSRRPAATRRRQRAGLASSASRRRLRSPRLAPPLRAARPAARPKRSRPCCRSCRPTSTRPGANWRRPGNCPPRDGDPCQAASAQQLQCYRTDSLTVPLLRQLGRPGILTLQAGNGPPVHAVLVGPERADRHAAGGGQPAHRAGWCRWAGCGAATSPPTGARRRATPPGCATAAPARRSTGSPVSWPCSTARPRCPIRPPPPVLDAALRARIRAFQRAQGLERRRATRPHDLHADRQRHRCGRAAPATPTRDRKPMSYILDALKRADAERERGAVPGLQSRHATLPAAQADPQHATSRSGWPPQLPGAGRHGCRPVASGKHLPAPCGWRRWNPPWPGHPSARAAGQPVPRQPPVPPMPASPPAVTAPRAAASSPPAVARAAPKPAPKPAPAAPAAAMQAAPRPKT